MRIPAPQSFQRYVDSEGRLTFEGMRLIQQMVAKINELEERVEDLEP